MNKFLKRITVVLTATMLLIFFLNIIIDNPYAHNLFRAAINEKIKSKSNLRVDFEAISLSIIPLGVDLYGNEVRLNFSENSDNSNKRVSLGRVSHIQIRVSLWSLFLGKPKLSVIKITDLEAIWPPPWDYPDLISKTSLTKEELEAEVNAEDSKISWPPKFDLPIERIVVKNGRAFLEAPLEHDIPYKATYFYTVINGLDIDIEIENWKNMNFDVVIKEVDAARDGSYMLEATKIEIKGELSGNQFTLPEFLMNGERVNLSGTIIGRLNMDKSNRYLDSISTQADLKTRADLTLLGSILDLGDTRGLATGNAKIDLKIPFDSDSEVDLLVTGNTTISDGYLSGFKLFDSSSKFTANQKQLNLSNLNIIINGISYANMDGKITFNDEVDYLFEGKPTGLHLMDLMTALNVDFDQFDFQLYSQKLKIVGKGNPFSMSVSALAELRKIRVPAIENQGLPKASPPDCRVKLRIGILSTEMALNINDGICYVNYSKSRSEIPIGGPPTLPPNAGSASNLNIDGIIRFNETGLDLKVISDSLDLTIAEYFAQIPLGGIAKINTRIHGPYSGVIIDNMIEVENSKIANLSLGKLSGNVKIENTIIKWKNVKSEIGKSGILKSDFGSLSTESLGIITQIKAEKITPKNISQILADIEAGPEISFGIDSLTANLKGPILKPAKILGQIDFDAYDVVYQKEKLADQVSAVLTSKKSGWNSKALEVSIGNLLIDATFEHTRNGSSSIADRVNPLDFWSQIGLHPDDEIVINLKSKKTRTRRKILTQSSGQRRSDNHMQSLPYAAKHLKSADIRGIIDLKSTLTGTLSHVGGTLSGKIERLVILGSPMAPLRIKGFVNGSNLDLTLDHSGNSLKGRLSMNFLDPGVPYEWYFSLNQFDLRPVATRLFFEDPRNYIYLTADWNMKGHFTDWWNSTGEANINSINAKFVYDSSVSSNAIFLKSQDPVTIDISKNGWVYSGQPLSFKNEFVKFDVRLPDNKPPERLSVKVTGNASLNLAKTFLNQIESSSGNILFTAGITGTINDPDISLSIRDQKRPARIDSEWLPLSIGIADIRPSFKNIEIDVAYSRGIFKINEILANKGNGRMSVEGSLNLNPNARSESNIAINLDGVAVSYPVPMIKIFDSELNGTISISGSRPPFRVGGDINIIKARSTRPFNIRNEIVETLRKSSISGESAAGTPLVKFELNIIANESIVIRNQNIDALFSTNLRIAGTDVKPEISGQIEISKGKFIYQQEFDIKRGFVTFDDPVRPDPSIDIVAVADVPPYRISVFISGKASNPIVEFSVDPPTHEDGKPITSVDTLVLLSRGKLPKGRALSNAGGVVTTEAANFVVGQFQQPLEKLLDLSGQSFIKQIYVDVYASEQDGSPLPRANVPINVGKDVDVVVSSDLDSAAVSLEYPLHEAITVSGKYKKRHSSDDNSSENDADTGIDLKFRFAIP